MGGSWKVTVGDHSLQASMLGTEDHRQRCQRQVALFLSCICTGPKAQHDLKDTPAPTLILPELRLSHTLGLKQKSLASHMEIFTEQHLGPLSLWSRCVRSQTAERRGKELSLGLRGPKWGCPHQHHSTLTRMKHSFVTCIIH